MMGMMSDQVTMVMVAMHMLTKFPNTSVPGVQDMLILNKFPRCETPLRLLWPR